MDKIKALIVSKDEILIKNIKEVIHSSFSKINLLEILKIEELLGITQKNNPDVLFLDIVLGNEKNTIEVLLKLEEFNGKLILLGNNNSAFAIEIINNFEVSYCLFKPYEVNNLKKAIQKVIKSIAIKKVVDEDVTEKLSKKVIAVSTTKTIEIIVINNILYLEAAGKYTVFHLVQDKEKIVSSKNLGEYEKILPINLFFRIHHKHIVNIQQVKSINKNEGGYCNLSNGKSLSIAKRRQELFRKFLQV